MIKKVILIIILIILLVLLINSKKEHFHEVTLQSVQEPSVVTTQANQCSGLSGVSENPNSGLCYIDYNPNPEDKDYILARCIKQHVQSDGAFLPTNSGCSRHVVLSDSSGCQNAVNHFWPNIETLYEISDPSSSFGTSSNPDAASESLSNACSCRYELDSSKPQGYDDWSSL